MSLTLSSFVRKAAARLEECYPPLEAKAIVLSLCESVLHVGRFEYAVSPEHAIDPRQEYLLETALRRLEKMEPLQYVTGKSPFYDMLLNVSPSVLIPRPETEELCRMAIDRLKDVPGARVLDLCTGSGCIAWALAANLPAAQVFGCDISDPALETAVSQPVAVRRHPVFFHYDLLSEAFPVCGDFDAMLSNPPYVTASEKASMSENVLCYEPHGALFVSDEAPLVFYEAIARTASEHLKPGGFVIAEINERFGDECRTLFSGYGFSDCRVIKDLNGKDRFCLFSRRDSQD